MTLKGNVSPSHPRAWRDVAMATWHDMARSLGAGKNPSDCLKVAEVGVMPKTAHKRARHNPRRSHW